MTRSDWRVQDRLILSASDRTRHLWLLRLFCDLVLVSVEESLGGEGALMARVRAHAEFGRGRLTSRLLKSVRASADILDIDAVERLRDRAEDVHAELAGDEEPARANAALQYRRLANVDFTFGSS